MNDVDRVRTILERQEIRRVELAEIYRFHTAEECPDCGKELDCSMEGDIIECSCSYSRFVPPGERIEWEPTTDWGDRNSDNRSDWGPTNRYRHPFAALDYDPLVVDSIIMRHRNFLLGYHNG